MARRGERLLNAVAGLGGRVLRAVPVLERPVFGLLRTTDVRPVRGLRYRLFKAWGGWLDGDGAVRRVTLPSGVRMLVDVRDWTGLTYIEPAAVEPVTTAYLLDRLRPGDVFADIGANVGVMGLQAAARVGPTGAVWCFEPNPRLVRLIDESARVNGFDGRVRAAAVALAESDDPARPFYLSQNPANSGLSSLMPSDAHLSVGRMGDPVTVRATTFDTFAAEHRIDRLDGVKIDVEGAEELVVRGMTESLARLRPRFLVVETATNSPAASRLRALGYHSRELEPVSNEGFGNVAFERDVGGD